MDINYISNLQRLLYLPSTSLKSKKTEYNIVPYWLASHNKRNPNIINITVIPAMAINCFNYLTQNVINVALFLLILC